MSLESTQKDAPRIKTIRETGRELGIPMEIVEGLVTLGYPAEECDEYFAFYKLHGYVRLSNNAGWGDKCPDQPTKPKDE